LTPVVWVVGARRRGGRGVAPGWPVTAVATTMDRLTWDEANELRARGGRALRRGELVEVDRSDESAARPRQPPAASRATRDVSATRPRGARTWRAIPRSTKASRPHRIPCRCLWTIAQRATSPLPQNPTVWLPRRVDPHCRRFEPSPAGRLDARTHDASPRPDHAPTSTTPPARVAGDSGHGSLRLQDAVIGRVALRAFGASTASGPALPTDRFCAGRRSHRMRARTRGRSAVRRCLAQPAQTALAPQEGVRCSGHPAAANVARRPTRPMMRRPLHFGGPGGVPRSAAVLHGSGGTRTLRRQAWGDWLWRSDEDAGRGCP
jgi:hypothetical protein